MRQHTLEEALLSSHPAKPKLTGVVGSDQTEHLKRALDRNYQKRLVVVVEDFPTAIHNDLISLYPAIAESYGVSLSAPLSNDVQEELRSLEKETRKVGGTSETDFRTPVEVAIRTGAAIARSIDLTLPNDGDTSVWIHSESTGTRTDMILLRGDSGIPILPIALKTPWAGAKQFGKLLEQVGSGGTRARSFSKGTHDMLQRVLLAMLEREDAPDGLPFALLTDSQRFIIVGLYQSVDERIAILSPLLEQDQLHPSLVSFAAYVLLRQPDRALPLSASTIARISRIDQQIPQAIEEEGGEEEEEESDQEEDDNERQDESDGGGEGQDGGGDGRDQGDGDGNGKDAGGSGEQPPLKRKKVDSTATYASFAAGGGVTSALALQESPAITVFVSPELAGGAASNGWPSLKDSTFLPPYKVYTHLLRRTLPSPPPYPPTPSSAPPTSPPRRTLCPPSIPPPSPLSFPLLPIKPDSIDGRHGRCHFGQVGDGERVVLKYGQLEHEARVYEEVLECIEGLAVPRLFGVFVGKMFDEEEMVLVLEYGGEQLQSWDDLSSAQKRHLYSTLNLLHSHHISHDDFAERNVLLPSPDAHPLLIDFAHTDINHKCPGEEKCSELRDAREELGL